MHLFSLCDSMNRTDLLTFIERQVKRMYKVNSDVIRKKFMDSDKSTLELATDSKLSLSTLKRLMRADRDVKHCTARRVFAYFGADSISQTP